MNKRDAHHLHLLSTPELHQPQQEDLRPEERAVRQALLRIIDAETVIDGLPVLPSEAPTQTLGQTRGEYQNAA